MSALTKQQDFISLTVISPEELKCCVRCKQVKSLSNFNSNRAKPDGKQSYCRDCQYEYYHTVSQPKYYSRPDVVIKKSMEESCRKLKAQRAPKPKPRLTPEELHERHRARQRWYIRTTHGRLVAARGYYKRELAKTEDPARITKLNILLKSCEEVLINTPLPKRNS